VVTAKKITLALQMDAFRKRIHNKSPQAHDLQGFIYPALSTKKYSESPCSNPQAKRILSASSAVYALKARKRGLNHSAFIFFTTVSQSHAAARADAQCYESCSTQDFERPIQIE
jgi:hypothetical protein